jgi:electron transport complex protein RnfG
MSGWDSNLGKLSGIYVLAHTETPGLGGNVNLVNSENTWRNLLTGTMKDETGKRPDFQEQFRGLTLDEAKLKQDGGKVDALTGATITSRAVCDAVQKSHKVLGTITTKQDKGK